MLARIAAEDALIEATTAFKRAKGAINEDDQRAADEAADGTPKHNTSVEFDSHGHEQGEREANCEQIGSSLAGQWGKRRGGEYRKQSDDEFAQFGGQLFEVRFPCFETSENPAVFQDFVVCDRQICDQCFGDAQLPGQNESGDGKLDGRQGLPWCHGLRGADVRHPKNVPMADRIREFSSEKLQMYDEHTGTRDWSTDFKLTKFKLEGES